MRETNIYPYYAFGYNYYILRYNSEGIPVHGTHDGLIARLDKFFARLHELDLRVTSTAAADLEAIRELARKMPENAKADKALAAQVKKAVDKLDATLDAELQLRSAFVVTPKRFSLESMLEKPADLFARNVLLSLPRICQFDFSQACRCIAFGLPTAAAFHLMRGVEGVLRHYYCSIVRRGRVGTLLWGPMVVHLRRRDAPLSALLDNLDNIRVNYRNPTQHTDARYDIDGAQDLLAVSIDATNRMERRALSEMSPSSKPTS